MQFVFTAFSTFLRTLNLVVDVVVVLTAVILTRRYLRIRSAALLSLAIGFWFRAVIIGLLTVSPYVVHALSGGASIPSGVSPSDLVAAAVSQVVQVLTIGSYIAIAYGAMIAQVPRRSRVHRAR